MSRTVRPISASCCPTRLCITCSWRIAAFPLIATSGNRSDEPIAIANEEATVRLKDIADHFLMHDRPIVRACDDSVVRLTRGRAGILRRARGYAPLGIHVGHDLPPVLAVGGHLKNTVAIAVGENVFLSQHIGDLETVEARELSKKPSKTCAAFTVFNPKPSPAIFIPTTPRRIGLRKQACRSSASSTIRRTWRLAPQRITSKGPTSASPGTAPDTASTAPSGAASFSTWKGTSFERIAHLRPFGLPGGDAAVREGWRSAASLMFDIDAFPIEASEAEPRQPRP